MLTIKQAAEQLGIATPTAKAWLRAGRFPHAVLQETPRGPVWMIPESDVANVIRPERPGRRWPKKDVKAKA